MQTAQWVAVVAPIITLLIGTAVQVVVARMNSKSESADRKAERTDARLAAAAERADQKVEADAQRAHEIAVHESELVRQQRERSLAQAEAAVLEAMKAMAPLRETLMRAEERRRKNLRPVQVDQDARVGFNAAVNSVKLYIGVGLPSVIIDEVVDEVDHLVESLTRPGEEFVSTTYVRGRLTDLSNRLSETLAEMRGSIAD